MSDKNADFDLDNLIEGSQKKPTSGKKLTASLRRPGTTQTDVSKAKGRTTYGVAQEVRKTIYLPDALREEIDAMAEKDGVPLMKFYQMLVDAGFALYKNGEIVIEFQEEVRVKKSPTWRMVD